MPKIAKVRGASIRPTLAPGDYLIVTKARALRAGFVVLVDHPEYGSIVKRVKSVSGDNVRLSGDNLDSTSSEALGDIPMACVKGRVRWAITPSGLKSLKRLSAHHQY